MAYQNGMDGGVFFRAPQLYLATSCRTGFSTARIKRYLNAWLTWWVRTSQNWHYQTVLFQFIYYCRDRYIAGIAMALLLMKDREIGTPVGLAAGLDLVVTARGL